MKENQKFLIYEKAEKMKNEFKNKWSFFAFILVGYSFLATLFTAVNSERCVSDITATWKFICKIFSVIVNVVYSLAKGASEVGDNISNPNLSIAVASLVAALVILVCTAAILAGLFFAGKQLVKCYAKHCWDEISPIVLLFCLATLIWGAELMPLNIILLLLISQAIYVIVRWYIDGYKENH